MAHLNGYNADKFSTARTNRVITIGGNEYLPVKKTGRVVKRILEIEAHSPQPPPPDDLTGVPDPVENLAYSEAAIDNLYQQIAVLLAPKDGKPGTEVDREALEDELDMEDARELLKFLMPPEEVGNQ